MGWSTIIRRARGRSMAIGAVVLAMAAGPGVVPVHGADDVVLRVVLGTCRITGYGPASTSDLLVAHRGSDGRLKRRARVDIDRFGGWTLDCGDDDELIERGDWIRVILLGSVDRGMAVPRLTLRIDRTTDIVNGRASPSGTLALTAVNCVITCGIGSMTTVPVSVTPQGTYAVDLTDGTPPDLDLLGVGRVTLSWTSPDGDTVSTGATVPYLQVIAGDQRVAGAATPHAPVTVTLRTDAGAVRAVARAVAGSDGRFAAIFRKPNLDPVSARVGDRITSDHIEGFSMQIPLMSISGNRTTNEVSGACPAGRPLRVKAINDPPLVPDNATLYPTCSASGTYLVDMDPNLDVGPGTRLQLRAQRASGDVVGILGGVPDEL